jgi:hypothetical protein
LTGERGQKRIHRPELEEMYGFDTKYAMHMLRLGFQGVELLTTGRLSLPMREPARSFLLDVRRGKVNEQDCLTRAGELEQELTDLATTSPLPDEPNEPHVEEWVLGAYRRRVGSVTFRYPTNRTSNGAYLELRLASMVDAVARSSIEPSGRSALGGTQWRVDQGAIELAGCCWSGASR